MSKPGKSLRNLCKKMGVRLTVKRGQKRVYKSVAVLKRQCVKKRKVTKKRKVRRRRKFGTALTSQQQDVADRAAGYNLRDIQFFSDHLMNGSHNNIVKMLKMIVPILNYERHFASKSIEWLIHNGFFRSSNNHTRVGDVSRPMDHLSNYLLLNYNNKVRLEPSSLGTRLLRKIQRRQRYFNTNDSTDDEARTLSNQLTKKWLLKTKAADDQHDWIEDKTFVFEAPNGRSRAMYSVAQQERRGNSPNPFIPLDEMIFRLNDEDLRAYKFFIRDHMKLYINYAAERASDKYTDRDRAYMDNHIEFISNSTSPIVTANGHRVDLETFLTRILDELILLKHRARVMVSNNNFSSNDICRNVKEPTNSEVRNNEPGKITYNVINPYINLCSCEDFYYSKFPIRDNQTPIHPQIGIKNMYIPKSDEPRRMCKHLRREPSGSDNFTWGPGGNFIYTPELLIQIRNGIDMMYDDNNNNNNIHLAQEEIRSLEMTRQLEIMRRREQVTAVVERNIFNNTRENRTCYLCFSKPLFLIKNCTGCDRNDRSILCGDSLICLGCIKNYPNNWRDNRIVNYRTKCGIGRGRLNNQKISDIEILRRFISVEEFNELSGTNAHYAHFFQQLPDNEINSQENEEAEARRRIRATRQETSNLMRELPRGGFFGKRKKKSSIPMSLKKVCKRLKIRLTTKRKGKRVYKSVKVLKEQCKKALKKKKKVLRKSKAGKKRKVVKKKKRKVKKRKVKKRKVKKRKVKKKRVKRRRKFGRNPTPSVTKGSVKNLRDIGSISGNPVEYQKYRRYKGSSSTYGF